ncbi:hypothetical protein ['Fragaria x ananassa' phyllody phytoplasma]|uniref:hypothetical protein n=1 Tax='Fragaria x ananassa' phyllody phytoplasma TaxID=2358428 RepID=UPI001CED9E35|nr:hypothetical protein ['Fragaria x ananassa' phyllody phytoplasma]
MLLLYHSLKNTFNNIIDIKDVNFNLDNILNSTDILSKFFISLFYILCFITVLVFIIFPIFNIIKIIKLSFKGIIKLIKLFIKLKLSDNQSIKPNEFNKYDLIKLQRKISKLEYKNLIYKKEIMLLNC